MNFDLPNGPQATASGENTRLPIPFRRLHPSTYVVLFLTATVLFFLNVPGR